MKLAGSKGSAAYSLLIAIVMTCCAGCGGGGNSSINDGDITSTLSFIEITPAGSSAAPGETLQFTATGTFSDGTRQDLSATTSWTSSDTAVATIDSTGLAIAVAAGSATITAASGGTSASTTLTVSRNNGKLTYIMIHLEAGHKACKTNNLPSGLYFPEEYCSKELGWQEYFWPTLIELVQKADEFDFKLTLAFNPQWAEYILKDSTKVNLIKKWQEDGHEIAFHHHGFDHPDWNGYSNRPEAENDSSYLGTVNDGYMFVENLALPYRVSSGTHSDLPLDFPSQMDIPDADIIFAEGDALDSYPQLGTVKSLKPYREPKPNGGFRVHLTIRAYSTVMQISLNEATPILKEQYKNMSGDEVFGIVWHEFDYYRSKDKYIEWFKFIQEQGDKVQTMENINASYFYP